MENLTLKIFEATGITGLLLFLCASAIFFAGKKIISAHVEEKSKILEMLKESISINKQLADEVAKFAGKADNMGALQRKDHEILLSKQEDIKEAVNRLVLKMEKFHDDINRG